MKDIINLTGKHILIVGASSGIGRATAILSSEVGAQLSIIARRKEELQKSIDMLEESHKHSYFVADFSDIEKISDVVEAVVDKNGKIDGIVYASGISEPYPLKAQTKERMDAFFDVNYFGFMELIRQCCKPRLYNKGLRIVGLSSTVVALGEKAHSIYAGTKGAMEASVRCLAQELAPKGICINTVEPGMTKTDMYKAFLEQWGENSEVHRKFLEKQYLGIVEPECVANTIVFLLSDAAKYITGTTVIVDGGLTSSC